MEAYKSRFACCVLLLICCLAGAAHGDEHSAAWLQTSPGELSLQAVRQLPEADWSRIPAGQDLNTGFETAEVWMRVEVPPSESERFLEISYPLLDSIAVDWFSGDQRLVGYQTGDRMRFDSRPVPHRFFLFPVPVSNEPVTAYLRIRSEGAIQVPISISDAAERIASEQGEYGWQALFLGIMVAMAVYNFFLLLVVRNGAYLWYVLTVVASALVIMNFNGLLFQWVWPDSPIMNRYFTTPSVALNVVFGVAFGISFLSLKKVSPTLYRVSLGLILICLLNIIYSFVGSYQASIIVTSAIAVVSMPMGLVIGLVVWWKGYVLARYYVIAWSPLLLGQLVNAMSKVGMISRTEFTETAPQIGAALEVMLMSFALASLISLERKRRQEAQEQTLEVQRQANQTLEARVLARTEELERANNRLEALTITDGLTQVANRRRFDDCLKIEFERARRFGQPLSLILLDIDNFKRLNDTYGHLIGDDCLISLASVCSKQLLRPSDFLARYGGEEFVVLLPQTTQSGAAKVAERLRRTVANTQMRVAGSQEHLTMTISAGVATLTPDSDHGPSDLIGWADEALYAAKDAGRNLVMVHKRTGTEEVESL